MDPLRAPVTECSFAHRQARSTRTILTSLVRPAIAGKLSVSQTSIGERNASIDRCTGSVDRRPVTHRGLADAKSDHLARRNLPARQLGTVRVSLETKPGNGEHADACFPPTRAKRNDEDRAADEAVIERISADMRRPIDDVRRLYLSELVELRSSARLHAFVSIIATKRVKAALRQPCAPAQPVDKAAS